MHFRFVAKEHLAGSSLHKKLQEEKDKIVKLTLPRFDARGKYPVIFFDRYFDTVTSF